MPKFTVRESIRIQAPLNGVYSRVRDFRQWPHWSPWLIADPECQVAFGPDGRSYAWEGRVVGRGEMSVLRDEAPQAIHYRLTFLKPWKSESLVSFLFTERERLVEVTWTLDGSLPIFLFWMRPMMSAWLGMDYQRGLSMLKDLIETGSVPSHLKFLGRRPISGFAHVGLRTACAIAEVGTRMEADFGKLHHWLASSGMQPSGVPLAIYHRWDLPQGTTEYTLGVPVTAPPSRLPDGFSSGQLPACEAYSIQHTGPYRHLGNAWAAGMMHARAKLFTHKKGVPPFETYESDPGIVPEDDLVTVIHFPAR